MMYTAGLTVREIAIRTNHHDNMVRLHLAKREQYRPGLRAKHEEALAARGDDIASPPRRSWPNTGGSPPSIIEGNGNWPFGSAPNGPPTTGVNYPLQRSCSWAK